MQILPIVLQERRLHDGANLRPFLLDLPEIGTLPSGGD